MSHDDGNGVISCKSKRAVGDFKRLPAACRLAKAATELVLCRGLIGLPLLDVPRIPRIISSRLVDQRVDMEVYIETGSGEVAQAAPSALHDGTLID